MSIQNHTPFAWSGKRERAAALAADDALTDEQIAVECGVKRDSIARWRRHPDFAARIAEHLAVQRAAIKAEGIANKQNRVATLDDLHTRLLQVFAERADAYAESGAPGATTGTVVRQFKVVGIGASQREIEEWPVDTGTIARIQSLQEQAAKELGQWVERRQTEEDLVIREYVGVDVEAV